jgi:hypothetical protein
MLLRSYCTVAIAAVAAMAATSPLLVATEQSSSSVRGRGRGTAALEDAAAASATKQQHRVLAGTTGRYLVQLIEYADDAFQLADAEPAIFNRRLRELQGNSGNRGPPSETGPKKKNAYELANGNIIEVEGLTKEDEESLSSGDLIILPAESTVSGNKINVHGKQVGRPPNAGTGHRQGRKLATLTGDKTVVGVKVMTYCNETYSGYSGSEAYLSSKIFDADAVNLATQYKACSHNKLNIIKPQNRSSGGLSISNGVLTVTVNSCNKAGDVTLRNEVTNAINAAFGVTTPEQIADHFMYCLPDGAMSGISYAFLNSWMSVYSDKWCDYVSTQMHEVGHNLNFDHAGEGTAEYGDQVSYRTTIIVTSNFGTARRPLGAINYIMVTRLRVGYLKEEVTNYFI